MHRYREAAAVPFAVGVIGGIYKISDYPARMKSDEDSAGKTKEKESGALLSDYLYT